MPTVAITITFKPPAVPEGISKPQPSNPQKKKRKKDHDAPRPITPVQRIPNSNLSQSKLLFSASNTKKKVSKSKANPPSQQKKFRNKRLHLSTIVSRYDRGVEWSQLGGRYTTHCILQLHTALHPSFSISLSPFPVFIDRYLLVSRSKADLPR